MLRIRVKGRITEDGDVQIDLPANWLPGEIEITLPVSEAHGTELDGDEIPWEERPWTDDELDELLTFKGKPLGEIETGGWEDMDIVDSAEWVEEMRRKERERRGTWTF